MIAEETNQKILSYINHLLEGSSAEMPLWNIEKIRSGKANVWNYIDGCMITAVLELYQMTGDEKYLAFADGFDGYFVKEDGSVLTYDPEEKNLDNINAARNLFTLYDLTGKEKYRKAMELFRKQITIQPRTESGNFWHKQIYPNQVWLDGLYMAQPFYMKYETRYNEMRGVGDSFNQFLNVRRFMKDPKTGLYYHGYDESRQMYWADPVTGCSKNFWLRATGWFAMALVETIAAIDESQYYEMRTLESMLLELAEALEPWQDASGMFWQVIDHPGEEGNYLETSGTALIACALMRGERLGFLPARYGKMGYRAFEGICSRYLTIDDSKKPEENGSGAVSGINLSGICLVAGLGGENHRDGTRKYYYSEPVVKNDAKGTGPFILAWLETQQRKR